MRPYVLLLIFLALTACHLFDAKPISQPVAKAGNHYLYKHDLAEIAVGESKEDSLAQVKSYINKWATRMLLLDKAAINLSEEQQREFNYLVENYKADLYNQAYVDLIADRELNTEINPEEYQTYYDKNRQNFVLTEDLIQLRYVHLNQDNTALSTIKEAFFRYNEKDREFLKEKEFQFKAFSFDDSLWVKASAVIEKIPEIGFENQDLLLKNNNKIELQDSLGVYLAFVKQVLKKNDIAPLDYVQPAIKQIILNQRKLEIIKNFEKDILQDAYKNKTFEIYP